MIDSEKIYDICVDFINSIPRVDRNNRVNLSVAHRVLEFQTLELKLPRQCGKTTAMKKLYRQLDNACVIVPNQCMVRFWNDSHNVFTKDYYTNNRMHVGLRIPECNYIILDECPIGEWLFIKPYSRVGKHTILISVGSPLI